MSSSATQANALDHIIVVLFENRSLDNLLGRLYGPADGKTFDGVIGKDLSSPIPAWAEHGAERKTVPYAVATDMDSPNPDSGEEWCHTNTQLFNVLDEHNRFKLGEGVTEPWIAPPAGATPTMDGFVIDYISTFTAEMGRQPTYDEYAQIMTGYTPEQVPLLNGIAREFGVFDHWSCEVPSQTFMNRSFWTAATSSGPVVNSPARKWMTLNDAETIFERLEQHRRTWKVYVAEPMPLAFAGVIHYPRLKDRLATHFVPFTEFETDAAAGTLPDFSFIEPNFIAGHGDYHPAFGRAVGLGMDPETWATIKALPVPEWQMDPEVTGKALSGLGKTMGPGPSLMSREMGVKLPPPLDDPNAELTPELIIEVLRDVAWFYFPGLAPAASSSRRP